MFIIMIIISYEVKMDIELDYENKWDLRILRSLCRVQNINLF